MEIVSKIPRKSGSESRHVSGLLMVLFSASLWGLSGTAAQVLFTSYHVHPGWLVTSRLLIAGLGLLALETLRGHSNHIMEVWGNKSDRLLIVVFGVLGMLGVQLTYLLAISHGNAATATLLQYLGPIVIIVFTSVRLRKMPTRPQLMAAALAILGTFLLVTGGSVTNLSISASGISWGLASAVALAFYTLFPAPLLKKYGAGVTTGWGMLVGGLLSSLLFRPWTQLSLFYSVRLDLLMAFVVGCGTFLAFYLYLDSLRVISPTQAGLASCAEPLSASTAALLWLHVRVGVWGMLGGICIVGAVVTLSLTPNIKIGHNET
ncbi:MAG: DMT family transporter [Firmicutes bacterium]|nr:DMT family transporter [Bacillota bacterium]